MLCLVIEHDMTSLRFQTAIQKNEAKLNYFVQFENEEGKDITYLSIAYSALSTS